MEETMMVGQDEAIEKNLSELENALIPIYTEFGKEVYTKKQNDGRFKTEFATFFDQIIPIFSEIEKIKADELQKKGLKKCPICQKEVTLESVFCNMCGHKFQDEAKEKNATAAIESQPRFCPNCGAELEQDAIFCHECGSKVE